MQSLLFGHFQDSLFGRLVEDLEVADKVGEVRVWALALDQARDPVQLAGRGQRLRRRRRRVHLQVRLAVLFEGSMPIYVLYLCCFWMKIQ